MNDNMNKNFELLDKRIRNSLCNTDLNKINDELKKIKEPTLVSGVGGSNTVSAFTAKVLNKTNKIITRNTEPRDFKYIFLDGYKNVISCSYSGDNYGVELSFDNDLKHYLLSSNKPKDDDVISLQYEINDDKEKSFISLSSTLIPCIILYQYYLNENGIKHPKEELINNSPWKYIDHYSFDTNCDCYEIFSGYDTSAASNFLESTLIEAGLQTAIIHDKYAYCHGRSTLSTNKNNIAIYLNSNKELDKLLLSELPKYYKDVIVINGSSDDMIANDFYLLCKCIYLAKYITEENKKDLSDVIYNPIAKKLYKYNGNL